VHFLSIDFENHISSLDTGFLSDTALLNLSDQDPGEVFVETQVIAQRWRKLLYGQPERFGPLDGS